MIHRTNLLVILLVCFSYIPLNTGIINSAYAGQKNTKKEQRKDPGKIYGKVTDIINVTGYTYAEVDTGKNKVWAAGPTTPLKKGDMIAFSSEMPMKNFHSKSMKRDFSMLYFIRRFITDEETSAAKSAASALPHSQIKKKQMNKAVKGISKVKGGNTITEVHANKGKLKGKTIRVRGQVTKFSEKIMGKNWLHIVDSSSSDDLTVTTNSTAAIGDIVIIEGKLELDKDFGYGYVYPVIVEDARIKKE
ncbi:MAG: DNA-binding protein [Proteobacteria bacterium]|nr:DNA-binding protein [Pseudomonadota bacterium]